MSKPAFCYKCRGVDTYERAPERDITTLPSGRVLELGWRCKVCGNTTLMPEYREVHKLWNVHDK